MLKYVSSLFIMCISIFACSGGDKPGDATKPDIPIDVDKPVNPEISQFNYGLMHMPILAGLQLKKALRPI